MSTYCGILRWQREGTQHHRCHVWTALLVVFDALPGCFSHAFVCAVCHLSYLCEILSKEARGPNKWASVLFSVWNQPCPQPAKRVVSLCCMRRKADVCSSSVSLNREKQAMIFFHPEKRDVRDMHAVSNTTVSSKPHVNDRRSKYATN